MVHLAICPPEELTAMADAFGIAWTELNVRSIHPVMSSSDPVTVQAARDRLGSIIVNLWTAGPGPDIAQLAVTQFLTSADPASGAPSDLA
jgi:hypothetical protein